MTSSEIVQLVFAGLVVLNLGVMGYAVLALNGQIARARVDMEASMKSLQEEATVAMQQAHDTLVKVEALSKSVDTLVNEQISPTLELVRATAEHVEATARAIRGSAEGARKVIGAVEGVATPASAAAMAGKLIGSPGGRASAAVVVGGTLLRALLTSRSHSHMKSAQPEERAS